MTTMPAREPPFVVCDFSSPEFKRNPFPTLARLVEAGPLVRTRFKIFGSVWMVTRYDAVTELLRDHPHFVQNPLAAGNKFMGRLFRWLPRRLKPLTTNMLLRDEPDHRRLRSLVDQAFLIRSVDALRPRLAALADESLDQLAAQAKAAGGTVDLIQYFARPFPLAVICELLGLPLEDRPKFTKWSSLFTTSLSGPGIVLGVWRLGALLQYVRDEIKRQTVKPRDGLLAALIQAEQQGERLTEEELVAMVFLLLAAGHETTQHQIACSVWTLFQHPEQRRQLTSDWSLSESAANELLRYVSFAQVSKPRFAIAETEFHGYVIPRGQMVFACLAAANADPEKFDQPARLDLLRHPNRHVAFGSGIHYCLGAALARMETEVALRGLFTRFPGLRLGIGESRVRFSGRPGTRGLVALPVRW